MLGRKQSVRNNEDWKNALAHIEETVSKKELDSLVKKTVKDIKEKCKGKKAAYAWSAGKDSLVLGEICEKAGVDQSVLVRCNLEYPAFIAWIEQNKPSGLEVINTRHSMEWLPEGGAIRPDGTIRPFVAIAKYMSGDNADGVASSISGVSPKNYSFQSSLTKFRAKGTQYCAETSQDSERMARLMEIAFATRHSQSVMAGCNWWWTQATATVQENDAERIIISKSAAKELVVGGTVSIGNANSLTSEGKANNDRGSSGLHAKANKVKITKIEDYDSNNAAVYVDNEGQKFSTAPTSVSGVTCETIISTMPWNTGGCDDVLGSCGSPVSNTSGKEPYILFGVEMSSGFWEPKGNTVMKIENHVMRPYICYDCTKMTTAGATTDDWVALGYAIPDNKGNWKYISKLGYSADDPEVRYPVEVAATSSTGYADGLYTENLETTGDSQREVLGSGDLDNGSVDGRRNARLGCGLSTVGWNFAARLSACGRCGRKAAA